eukprot:1666758-Rhodomonas_salina.1
MVSEREKGSSSFELIEYAAVYDNSPPPVQAFERLGCTVDLGMSSAGQNCQAGTVGDQFTFVAPV